MQVNDDRDMWMGLGYVLAGSRFSVQVSKDAERKTGYRVRLAVRWADNEPPVGALACVHHVLWMMEIEYKPQWTTQADLMRWVALIRRLDDLYNIMGTFHDQGGLHMFMWVFDNPPPATYEEFVEWATAFDEEEEQIGSSI